MMNSNPNFPSNLDITPSQSSDDSLALRSFDFSVQEAAIREYGIAGRVWEAAYFMSSYISGRSDVRFDPPFLTPEDETRHLTVLELGSGTGVVSEQCMRTLAGKAATIIATDLPEVCPLLEKNLCKDPAAQDPSLLRLLIRPLAWGNHAHVAAISGELQRGVEHASSDTLLPDSGPNILSHIICSDLVLSSLKPYVYLCTLTRHLSGLSVQVYFPELLAPLLRSLLELSSPPFASRTCSPERWPKIIVSYRIRSLAKETPFWSTFGLWFSFEPVLWRKGPVVRQDSDDLSSTAQRDSEAWSRFGAASDDEIFVFVGRRKPESLNWEVPTGDFELLGGAGAGGNRHPKSDDTFETLLLMGLSSE